MKHLLQIGPSKEQPFLPLAGRENYGKGEIWKIHPAQLPGLISVDGMT